MAFVGTIYTKVDPFKFTPGHRAILLQISDSLDQKKRKHNLAIGSMGSKPIISQQEQQEESLKKKASLISKLKFFLQKQSIPLDFKEDDIVDFLFENNQYKCKVKCSICNKVTPGFFNNQWAVSNIEKHFKRHAVANAAKDLNAVTGTVNSTAVDGITNTNSNSDSIRNQVQNSTQSSVLVTGQSQTTEAPEKESSTVLSITQEQIEFALNQLSENSSVIH